MSETLFMVLIGCKPKGRHTEQHDIFFGIGHSLSDLVPKMKVFWPEAADRMHVDAWRSVKEVDGHTIEIHPRTAEQIYPSNKKLFFVNLGGYKENDFEEYHYKQLVVAESLGEASATAKQNVFYKRHISPHIDDKYGIDVDDIYQVDDLLDDTFKEKFQLVISEGENLSKDTLEIGYLKFSALEKE